MAHSEEAKANIVRNIRAMFKARHETESTLDDAHIYKLWHYNFGAGETSREQDDYTLEDMYHLQFTLA